MYWQKENFGHLQTLIARQLFVRPLYLLIRLRMISMFIFFVSICNSSVIILRFLITRVYLINICLFQWLLFCILPPHIFIIIITIDIVFSFDCQLMLWHYAGQGLVWLALYLKKTEFFYVIQMTPV